MSKESEAISMQIGLIAAETAKKEVRKAIEAARKRGVSDEKIEAELNKMGYTIERLFEETDE